MTVLSCPLSSLLLTVALVLADPTSSCADTSSLITLFRAYSGNASDHFYTTNVSELDNDALLGGTYTFEGEATFLWSTSQPSTIPLFRLYNQDFVDHFYTMSSDEVLEMIDEGWAYDNTPNHTAGYVYPYSICGAAPIYRLFNPESVDHFYTMNIAESQDAMKDGYQDQGIAGFAMLPSVDGSAVKDSAGPFFLPSTMTALPESQASATTTSSSCADDTNAVPLLRAFNSSRTDHLYTTNSTEMNDVDISLDAYSFEGDAAFVWSTQEASTVPLYRLFNQNVNDHFYTIDANESNEALSLGYAFDTDSHIAGYVYPYSVCGAAPIYRLYSTSKTDHFYTMSQTESASAAGYVVEGIAGFALLPSVDGQPQMSATPLLLPHQLSRMVFRPQSH
ncbi:hypothetical protein F5890DRAFT_1583782 [Lentinula detonsa]|uniref:DUF5648 domain-containing protein n=1 Tax=Lentinula detonsa TaxID=2804962 RepID=A0AA38Q776_9AGAR|nr:hypothetical protein F5890DRAFT_1583782 [Lentinula detonsa]